MGLAFSLGERQTNGCRTDAELAGNCVGLYARLHGGSNNDKRRCESPGLDLTRLRLGSWRSRKPLQTAGYGLGRNAQISAQSLIVGGLSEPLEFFITQVLKGPR